MNEKQIKQLYSKEIESSAPDMDALWSRIESGLAEKPSSVSPGSVTADSSSAERKKPFITLKKGLALAAVCAVLAVIIPAARIGNINSMDSISEGKQSQEAENFADNEVYSETNATVQENSNGSDEEFYGDGALRYEDLDLAFAEKKNPVCGEAPYEPYGGDYFSEEDILLETEYFIDAVVDNVYADGSSIYYELKAASVFSAEGNVSEEETITVASRSKHEMLEGREYLIPVKSSAEGLRTVFDGVPQIEIVSGEGLVFYNGWTSLVSDNSRDIIYPKSGVDDFFYDRMKFSYGDYRSLLKKWEELKK